MFPGDDYSTPTDPLLEGQDLRRYSSSRSHHFPERGHHPISTSGPGRTVTQKLYIDTEDLTAVITGFRTKTLGLFLGYIICILSFGIGYLVFHWFPSWWVAIVGYQVPLSRCDWVVIEVGISPLFFTRVNGKRLILILLLFLE